jgi:O-antigen/teichoic acid export membrane protein
MPYGTAGGLMPEPARGPAFTSGYRSTLWAVADQCAVSGGNFLTNLILLRSLLPVEFGTYSLVLSAMLFCNNLQQAFVTYPLCVRGARANRRTFQRVLAFSLYSTGFLILTIFGPSLSITGAFLHRSTIIIASVMAMLLWQLQDTLRAGFVAKLEQKRALIGDATSYLGQAVLLGLVCMRTKPSLNFIFWTIAGTSLLAVLVQIWQIRPLTPPRRAWPPLVREFWLLGRWSVVAKLMGFFTLQAFPWLIVIRHGRVEVAGFQALFQFLAFTNPLLFSIGSLIIATVARDRSYRTKEVRNYVALVVGSLGGYLLVLGVAGPFAMRILYGSHSQYLEYAALLRLFAAGWFFEVIAQLTTAILGGLRQPRAIFVVQMSGAVAAALIALPWIYFKGLPAAAICLLLVNLVRAATGILLLFRRRRAARPEAGFDTQAAREIEAESAASLSLRTSNRPSTLEEEYAEP